MAKHHSDLVFCRKLPGIAIGRLCEKCDGKCVICDSYVRPHVLVRICDECNYGSFEVIVHSDYLILILSLLEKDSSLWFAFHLFSFVRDVALFVVRLVYLTPITAVNARYKKKMYVVFTYLHINHNHFIPNLCMHLYIFFYFHNCSEMDVPKSST